MNKTGLIYIFVDNDEKPFYVGKTINLKNRIVAHLLECKNNNKLYKYNKLRKILSTGLTIDEIIIIVEDNIDINLLDDKEIYYIKKLREDGYKLTNLTNGGDGGDTFSNNPNREDIRKKRKQVMNDLYSDSERKKEFLSHRTDEWKEKIKKAKTGVPWGKHSDETKKKISEIRKGIKFSEEHKKKLSIARKKRITTYKTRQKMSKSSKGRINIKKYKLIDPNGIEYITTNGLAKFCEENNLTSSNLMKVLKGDRNHHKGWTIKRM